MKKLLVFVLLVAAGFVVYKYVLKEKPVLEINADKSISTQYSDNIEAPALAPGRSGLVQGTVKNVSDNEVTNIVLTYKLNAEPVEARIDRLEPGETKNFSTQSVMLRHAEVTFFLDNMSYE